MDVLMNIAMAGAFGFVMGVAILATRRAIVWVFRRVTGNSARR
jgi:hypothetical protein